MDSMGSIKMEPAENLLLPEMKPDNAVVNIQKIIEDCQFYQNVSRPIV